MSKSHIIRCSSEVYKRIAIVAGEKCLTLSEALDHLLIAQEASPEPTIKEGEGVSPVKASAGTGYFQFAP